jgi:small-conductance mechanosensitive channel
MSPEVLIALTSFVCAYLLGDALTRSSAMLSAITAFGGFALFGCWQPWSAACAVAVFAATFVAATITHRVGQRSEKPQGTSSWIRRRLLHIGLVAAIVLGVYYAAAENPYTWIDTTGVVLYQVLILVTGAVVAVASGSDFMSVAIRPFAEQLRNVESHSVEPRDGFIAGGRTIGRYERLLVFIMVLTSSPIAIGFLIAAKSIFRFGDLTDTRNRQKAEYILLGTLMSFTFAVIVSLLARAVLNWYGPG